MMATTVASERDYKGHGQLLALFIAYVCFYVLGAMYLPRALFLELLNGILASIAIVVSAVYLHDIKACYRRGFDGVVLLSAGIVIGWSVAWIQAVMRIYYFEFLPNVGGRTFDALVGLPAFGSTIGCSLHLLAIGVDKGTRGFINISGLKLKRNILIVVRAFFVGCLSIWFIKLVKPIILLFI